MTLPRRGLPLAQQPGRGDRPPLPRRSAAQAVGHQGVARVGDGVIDQREPRRGLIVREEPPQPRAGDDGVYAEGDGVEDAGQQQLAHQRDRSRDADLAALAGLELADEVDRVALDEVAVLPLERPLG